MPRAILTFHLPRKQPEFELAQAAPSLAGSLTDVARLVRDSTRAALAGFALRPSSPSA